MIAIAILISLCVFSQEKSNQSRLPEKQVLKKVSEYGNINPMLVKFLKQNSAISQNLQMKNGSADKIKLDSIISDEYTKEQFIYDSEGNMITDMYFELDKNSWYNYYKLENILDENDRTILTKHYYNENNQWVMRYKDEYSYTSEGNLLNKTNYMLDIDSSWTVRYKYQMEYNDSGNMTSFKYDLRSETTNNELLPYYKAEMHYDSNNNLTLIVEFAFLDAQLGYDRRTSYTYNTSGNVTQMIDELWSGVQWVNYTKIRNQYDSKGNIVKADVYDWDAEYGDWLNYLIYEYEYNAKGKMTLYDIFLEDINYLKEEWLYDDYDNMIQYTYSYYYSDLEELLPMIQEVYEYDNSYSYEDLILPQFSTVVRPNYEATDYSELFNHKLVGITYYEDNGVQLEIVTSEKLYYSDDNSTGISRYNTDDIVKLYPNPASNQLTFQLGNANRRFNVAIFDALGKKVYSNIIENNMPVSTQSLNDGLYFYQLTDGDKIYSGKLIVNK